MSIARRMINRTRTITNDELSARKGDKDKFPPGYIKRDEKPNPLPSAEFAGSAHRRLREGEIILATDEWQHDDGSWGSTICAGQKAPCPLYTSHRQYRRKIQ